MKSLRGAKRRSNPRHAPTALLLILAALAYALALSRGVSWGDGAKFPVAAGRLHLSVSALGHPLYIAIAHLFTYLPFGDLAFRVNLLSPLFALLTLLVLHRVLLRFASSTVAFLSTLLFALSHTFWFHAAIAEVYTLNTFFETLTFLFLLEALENGRPRALATASFFLALGLSNHLFVALLLPAAFTVFFFAPRLRKKRTLLATAGAALIGASPLIVLFLLTASREGFLSTLYLLLGGTFLGDSLAPAAPPPWSIQIAVSGFWHLWQFSLPGLFLAAWGFFARAGTSSSRKKTLLAFIALAVHLAFGFFYRVDDQFAFQLPGYLFLTVFIASGAQILSKRSMGPILLISAILLNLAAYAFLPARLAGPFSRIPALSDAANSYGAIHHGRTTIDNIHRLLTPWRADDPGARRMAAFFRNKIEKDAVVIADWHVWSVLKYNDLVNGGEGRPEVRDVGRNDQLSFIRENLERRPLYYGSTDPVFQNTGEVSLHFDLLPAGPFLRITPKSP